MKKRAALIITLLILLFPFANALLAETAGSAVYTGTKLSVQELQDGQRVMIYRSVYNDKTGQYEDVVIDGQGQLVKVYDKGSKITGHSDVSAYWTVIVHRDETTGEPNGYYDFYNEETGVYLCPKSDGTLVSSQRPGVTLNGRRDGEYNSTIEAWDGDAWVWCGYQVQTDGNGEFTLAGGTGEDSQAFSFAAYEVETPNVLHPVATVDSVSAGITIQMYDFDNRTQITNVVGGNNYQVGNNYNNSGLASLLLVNGYPNFSSGNASTLFSSNNSRGQANHLFLASVYNSTGYYEYSAFNNYARYDQSTGNFTVYQETGTPSNDNQYYYKRGNFFPYNDLDPTRPATNTNQYDGGGATLDADDPTNGGRLYLINNPNFYFGMTMSFTFMQPRNGYYQGSPMIYEFNGDDDLWVYIDGVKILDIGGVHDALPGSINFATGKITYGANGANMNTTIKACFKAAGVFPDGTAWDDSKVDQYFKGDTFADYGSHSFNMFYMEHGAGASNLEMRFNLPVIEKGKFTVEKLLDGTTQEKFANVYFAYQAYKKDDPEDEPLTGAVYEGTDTPVNFYDSVEINGKTYTNVFYLKPGEAATFPEMADEEEYYVQELGIGTDYYDEVIVNDVKIDGEEVTATDGVYPTTVATVGSRARVTYSNHCSEKNLNELRITKKLAEGETDDGSTFEFRVQLENADGELVPYATSPYYIQNEAGEYFHYVDGRLTSNGFTPIVASVTGNNGTIAGIPAGYTVVVTDLLAGTDFHVEEIRVRQADGTNLTIEESYWELERKEVVADTYDESSLSGTDWRGQTITADGQIRLDTAAKEVFVNKSKPFDTSVNISGSKILKGRDQNAGEFFFTLTEINLDGTEKEDGLRLTVSNSAGAAEQPAVFSFGGMPYTAAQYYGNRLSDGSAYFYYVVKETIPEDGEMGAKDSVIYDQSQYLVIVRLWLENGAPASEWNAYPYDGNGVPARLLPVETQMVMFGVPA